MFWLIHQLVSLVHNSLNVMRKTDFQVACWEKWEPSEELVVSAWKEWLLNHTVSIPLFTALILYPLFVWRGGVVDASVPSLGEMARDIAVCIFANETIFYFSHRLLHNKKLFRMIHRKHHMFRQVRPVSSEYAHPLENLLNLISMYAGLVIMGSPFFTWGLWVAMRIYETNDGHSGYEHLDSASKHVPSSVSDKGCYGTAIGFGTSSRNRQELERVERKATNKESARPEHTKLALIRNDVGLDIGSPSITANACVLPVRSQICAIQSRILCFVW